jgi:hypothetical protein
MKLKLLSQFYECIFRLISVPLFTAMASHSDARQVMTVYPFYTVKKLVMVAWQYGEKGETGSWTKPT